MLATTCKTPPLRLAQLFSLRVAGRQTAHSPRVRSTNSCNKGLIVRAGSMLLRSQRSDMIPNSDRVMTLREELLQRSGMRHELTAALNEQIVLIMNVVN